MTSVLDIITHYQRSIEKSSENEERLLHCISRLYRLPVKVEHLQETGVGKTVNSLRKYNGEIGVAAKTLVTKWKAMVAAEEELDNASYEEDKNEVKQPSDDDQERCTSNAKKDETNENPQQTQCRNNDKHEKSSTHMKISTSSSTTSSSSNKHHKKPKNYEKSSHYDPEPESGIKEKLHESILDAVAIKKEFQSPENSDGSSGIKNDKFAESNGKKEYRRSNKREKSSSKSRQESVETKSEKKHRSEKQLSKNSSSSNSGKEHSSSSHRKRHKSNQESKHSSSPKPKIAKVLETGIDGSMGASFEDALGMCNMPSSSKSKPIVKSSIKSSPTTQKHGETRKQQSNKTSSHSNIELLSSSCKLEPLDSSIILDLPTITTNYKPAPLNQTVMDCVFPQKSATKPNVRPLNDYEALDRVMSSKTMRTKIYSGTKSGSVTQVSSLFDLCIRILQKNIDALEYTGGVPFSILQPILQRATPMQLFAVEEYNPYLIEDTDVLWEQLVIRNYRGKKREEMETWREMFMRCQTEQEEKLNLLTENIKISQLQSALPVRKTQLAYVDSIAKPPRGIQRKQELYGTKEKLVASPAARVAALSSVVPNAAKSGDVRLRMAQACARDPMPLANPMRPKKAPLMAKALQQFNKGRFQR